jgi:hypothetical protein
MSYLLKMWLEALQFTIVEALQVSRSIGRFINIVATRWTALEVNIFAYPFIIVLCPDWSHIIV